MACMVFISVVFLYLAWPVFVNFVLHIQGGHGFPDCPPPRKKGKGYEKQTEKEEKLGEGQKKEPK